MTISTFIWYVLLKLIVAFVHPSLGTDGIISCRSNATNSIRIQWNAKDQADYYIVTWYSVTEYNEIFTSDSNTFREEVLNAYEDSPGLLNGIDYARAFEDTAGSASMFSYGYLIKQSGVDTDVTVTSQIQPNSTYDVSIRVTGNSSDTAVLRCLITTLPAITFTTDLESTVSSGPSSTEYFDPMILYIVIPGTVMSLLTVSLLAVLLNRRWRNKILREKTPVRVIASRESDLKSEITVSFGYSSDSCSRPTSSDSCGNLSWRDRLEGSTLKNRRKDRQQQFRHYVVNHPNQFVPLSSPATKYEISESEDEDSYCEDDPFDRLHHRHSLTTVSEESDGSNNAEETGRRYARYSAKTFDSRLTSRECSFVSYRPSSTPSREFQTHQTEHNYTLRATTRTDNVWSALSSRYSDEDFTRSRPCWHEDDDSEYSARRIDSSDYIYASKESSMQARRRRPWIERRHRRVIPSLRHAESLLHPNSDVYHTSEEGARLLGYPNAIARDKGQQRRPTPAIGVRRQGTPSNTNQSQLAYITPHSRRESTPGAPLRTTKSSRNILIL